MGLPVNLIVALDQKLSRRHAAEVLRAVRCMAKSRTAPGQRPTPHERGVVIELQMAPIEAADGTVPVRLSLETLGRVSRVV
jgi:hypothetical protein